MFFRRHFVVKVIVALHYEYAYSIFGMRLGVSAVRGGGPPSAQKWVDCKAATPDGQAERAIVPCPWMVGAALSVSACL